MKRKLASSALGLLALLICAVPAYPWGWAAHTYIIDHVGTKRPAANLQEIYGWHGRRHLQLSGPC